RESLLSARVVIQRDFSSFAGGENQIIPTITVQIEPSHSWPKLAETNRKQRLARKILERVLVVAMAQQGADVLEECRGSSHVHNLRVRGFSRTVLTDFVDVVGSTVLNN